LLGNDSRAPRIVNVSKSEHDLGRVPDRGPRAGRHWRTGEHFDKNIVPFRCWQKAAKAEVRAGLWRPLDLPSRVPPPQVRKLDGLMAALDGSGAKVAIEILGALGAPARFCKVCQKPVAPHKMFCPGCLRLVHRTTTAGKLEQAVALINALYLENEGFRCHHCGVLMELGDRTSPWYMWYGHLTPGVEGKVVASSAVMNRMKTDTSEGEFHVYMVELDKAMSGGVFDTSAVSFEYWNRHGQIGPAGGIFAYLPAWLIYPCGI
jgi:hypothetical protein